MLHGEIKVNDGYIGKWSAVRKERTLALPDEVDPEHNSTYYRYDCHVEYFDMGGYLKFGDFTVTHRYGDGPLMLTAKVLIHAQRHLKRPPIEADNEQ